MSTLDHILSGGGESVPSSDETVPENLEPVEASTEAGSQDGPAPADNSADPQGTEEERERRRGSGAQLDAAEERHRQELERARKEEADKHRRILAAEKARWDQEVAQRREQEKRQQAGNPADVIFTDPVEGVRMIYQPDLEAIRSEAIERQMVMSRSFCEMQLGPERFKEVNSLFDSAVAEGRVDADALRRVSQDPLPWLRADEWLKQQERLSPDYDTRLKDKYEAEFREKYGITGGSHQAQASTFNKQAMPSDYSKARNVANRSTGPAWAGPDPIKDIFNRARSG